MKLIWGNLKASSGGAGERNRQNRGAGPRPAASTVDVIVFLCYLSIVFVAKVVPILQERVFHEKLFFPNECSVLADHSSPPE